MTPLNALLVYPSFPRSFWGAEWALEIAGKKWTTPPLGLLTVAALFPDHHHLKVVDMNVEPLTDAHLEWSDLVLTSTMVVQQQSHREVVARCNALGRPLVAGGPYPTTFHDDMENVDHFVLGEVEDLFGQFIQDFERGRAAALYEPERDAHGQAAQPDLRAVPIPRFDRAGGRRSTAIRTR